MKAIKKNLKDQIGTDERAIMYCTKCGAENSADAGDYWLVPEDHRFKCCGRIMELVVKRIVYDPVEETR